MTGLALMDIGRSIVGGAVGLQEIGSSIQSGSCTTVTEKVDLVAKLFSTLFSFGEAAGNVAFFILGGSRISQSVEQLTTVVRSSSAFLRVIQSATRVAVKQERGTATLNDYGGFIAPIGESLLSLVPKGAYDSAAQALTTNEVDSRRLSVGFQFFVKLLPNIPTVFAAVQKIFMPPPVDPMIWISPERPSRGNFSWERFNSLAAQVNVQPLNLECLLEAAFIGRQKQRFICPLSGKIISEPLRLKSSSSSGVLFEKTMIIQRLVHQSPFSFTWNGHNYQITEDSLEDSLEDVYQIARETKHNISQIFEELSCRLATMRRQSVKNDLSSLPLGSISAANELARKRLDRLWRQVSFVDLKTFARTQLKEEFDTLNRLLASHTFWKIDPRGYAVDLIKNQVEKEAEGQKTQLEQAANPQEFVSQLARMPATLFPGVVNRFILSSCNPLTNFEPLGTVKRHVVSKIPSMVSHFLEEGNGLVTPSEQHGGGFPSVTTTLSSQRSHELARDHLSHLMTQRSFADLKVYVWTRLEGYIQTLKIQIRSRSYWPIDPKQWFIEFGKHVLSTTEASQKRRFEKLKTMEELRANLQMIQSETIPGFLKMFNPLTSFMPLTLVKQTLIEASASVSQVIEEVRDTP